MNPKIQMSATPMIIKLFTVIKVKFLTMIKVYIGRVCLTQRSSTLDAYNNADRRNRERSRTWNKNTEGCGTKN